MRKAKPLGNFAIKKSSAKQPVLQLKTPFGQQVVAQPAQLLCGIILIPPHHDFNSLEFEGFRNIGAQTCVSAPIETNDGENRYESKRNIPFYSRAVS